MWKLKFSHFFKGYGIFILFLSIVGASLGMIFSKTFFDSDFIALIYTLIGMMISCLAAFLYLSPSPKAKEKIRSAGEPVWRELEPYEYEELLAQQTKRSSMATWFFILQMPVLLVFFILIKEFGSIGTFAAVTLFIIEGIILLVCFTHLLISSLVSGKWENVDATARIAEIPIDSTYTVKGGSTYYVYYLRSGRYVVDKKQLYSD